MTQRLDAPVSSPSPETRPDPTVTRPRAPLVGVIVGVLAVGAFFAWTATRIKETKETQASIATQRDEDTKRARAEANTLPQVSVVTPTSDTWVPVVEIDGTIAAGQSAELGFKTGGRIAQLSVRVGDTVKAGQLLASLDGSEANAQLKAAQAQVRAAEAQLALATDTERRTAVMVERGSAAEASGVQTIQQKALANAQLEASRAQVSLGQVALGNHRLTAPFAGSITRAPDGVGGVVGAGTPLFEIVNLKALKLKGTLGEHDAALVVPGAKLTVETEQGAVEGKVSAVLGSVDPATRRVRIEADLDNADGRLRAGSFVRAKVAGVQGIPVLKLPHAVLKSGTQDEVLVVTGGVLASRRIVYSVNPKGELYVRHGLGATEQVVLAPKVEAAAGDRVTVGPLNPAPAPAAKK
jgi:RND family efflux transporter MFP subunit